MRWTTGLFGLALLSALTAVRADTTGCQPPPAAAVTKLPPLLARWGALVCTPYGYIITAREGWIWSQPGGYAPVWIPAQMVRERPALLGARAYFTHITFTPVSGRALDRPDAAFHEIFPGSPKPRSGYRLDVVSSSGKSLRLYFLLDAKNDPWGVWCPGNQCRPRSFFMLLNMTRRAPGHQALPLH